LIKKLSPLINFNNTRLDNQLYELLEKAYRELDLSMMSRLQVICEQVRTDSTLTIGDMKTLLKAKEKYEALINENEEIILNIKCSDSFDKKRILEDENLIRRTKEEINKEIKQTEDEIKKAEKELKKLQES
jgi:predicted O-linked N-acetylglucosamine transferase (SPINDLY family)